jgi:hypothetical protein
MAGRFYSMKYPVSWPALPGQEPERVRPVPVPVRPARVPALPGLSQPGRQASSSNRTGPPVQAPWWKVLELARCRLLPVA